MSQRSEPNWLVSVQKVLSEGQAAIVVDDTDELPRSALVFSAQDASAGEMNRCLTLSGGSSVFVAISPARAEAFRLEAMGFNRVPPSGRQGVTPRELVSVEARTGVTTGISASDRATTVRILGAESPNLRDLVKPGHIFPVRVREGGVLVRSAIAEAAVDLMHLCSKSDACCFLEIYNSKGNYASLEEVEQLHKRNGLPLCTISDLIALRLREEELVQRVREVKLPTLYESDMRAYLYSSKVHKGDHIAIVKGDIQSDIPTLTRVHPESIFQDVFGPGEGDEFTPLQRAMKAIAASEVGVLVYLRRPDKQPLSLELKKTDEYLRSKGATMKEYGIGAQILRDLGVCQIDLLSSSGAPAAGLMSYGLRVVRQSPLS